MDYLRVSRLAGIHRTTEFAENGFEIKPHINSPFQHLRKFFFREKSFLSKKVSPYVQRLLIILLGMARIQIHFKSGKTSFQQK